MKFDDIHKMIESDSKLELAKLQEDSLRVPYLQGKYINMHSVENGKYRRYELELKRLKFKKYEYYGGKALAEEYRDKPLDHTILKSDVQKYIDGDDDVFELENRMMNQKVKVDMLAEFIKSLSQRTFLIKSAIDYIKFTNGL